MKKTILRAFAAALPAAIAFAGCADNGAVGTGGDADMYLDRYNEKTAPAVTYTLTVAANPGVGGSVSRSLSRQDYDAGTEVTVTASANAGYTFTGWTGPGAPSPVTTNPVKVTMNGNLALTANFQQQVTETPDGVIVPGIGIAGKMAWLERNAESHNTYIIEVAANENVPPKTFQYDDGVNITVIIRGSGANRTVRLSSNGTMFTVNSNVTLILDDNITLMGHPGNTGVMVSVNGGTFRMNAGAAITGNIRSGGGNGGGVYVSSSGTVLMNGGTISGNTAANGGGVYVYSGTFTVNGGAIEGNTSGDGSGGGGDFRSGTTFTMSGGTISGNNAGYGGGVYVDGTFNMRGGEITGNIAASAGGGVYVYGANFTKTGGIITGHGSDPGNGNVVRDHVVVIARSGHAVYAYHYYNGSRRKEITAGPGDNLSFSGYTSDGVWDE